MINTEKKVKITDITSWNLRGRGKWTRRKYWISYFKDFGIVNCSLMNYKQMEAIWYIRSRMGRKLGK